MSVIRGNAAEEDIYSQTMEHLAEQAGQKLGEIEDFQRLAQGFMDYLDLKQGVITDDALAKLEAYQQKLLLPGTQEFLRTPAVPASKQTISGQYATLLKKGDR